MKVVIKIILVILWMGVIFYFSNQEAKDSTKMSDTVILKVYDIFKDSSKLSTNEKEKLIKNYVFITRKMAHSIIYFILGILVFILLIENKNITRLILATTIICMLYATSDEIHQKFVKGRSCEIRDVLIDTTSAFISSSMCFYLYKKSRKNYCKN